MIVLQKVAFVTNASQGMGATIIRNYCDMGFLVVSNCQGIRTSHSLPVVEMPGDIDDPEIAEHLIEMTMARFGRIDTLVHNGVGFTGKVSEKFSVEDYHAIMRSNIGNFVHITRSAIAEMTKQGDGHILHYRTAILDQPVTASAMDLAAWARSALDAIIHALAIEYIERGIRVNGLVSVADPSAHGEQTREHVSSSDQSVNAQQIYGVGDAILYLERTSSATGEILCVDARQTS